MAILSIRAILPLFLYPLIAATDCHASRLVTIRSPAHFFPADYVPLPTAFNNKREPLRLLTESKMDSFYVNLFSNVGSQSSARPNNDIAVFDTLLSTGLTLDEDFEVCLTEISFTNSWYNLNSDALVLFSDQSVGGFITDTVKAGRYATKEALVDAVNIVVESLNLTRYVNVADIGNELIDTLPILGVDQATGIVSCATSNITKSRFKAYFDDQLRGLLGGLISPPLNEIADEEALREMTRWMRNKSPKGASIKELTNEVSSNLPDHGDLTGGLRSVLVYTDIVRFSYVGDKLAPLLKVVHIPSRSRFEEQVFCGFESLEYRPLTNRNIQQIQIALYDDVGQVIPFRFGRVRCTLHFRPARNGFR